MMIIEGLMKGFYSQSDNYFVLARGARYLREEGKMGRARVRNVLSENKRA